MGSCLPKCRQGHEHTVCENNKLRAIIKLINSQSAFYYHHEPDILVILNDKILLPTESASSLWPMPALWHHPLANGPKERGINLGQRS